jgi:ribosomal protein L18
MKTGPRYHVKPRRHRERKTDYRLRLKLLRSKKPRIVVRKSLKAIRVQFVEYSAQGDKNMVGNTQPQIRLQRISLVFLQEKEQRKKESSMVF